MVEVKESGERVAAVRFEADALDAAYEELDERYGTADTTAALLPRINARDWDAVAEMLAPDLVIEDHRRLGWGTLRGPEAYLAALRALVELAPDATLRLDHLEESGRVSLGLTMLSGTREGGVFEDARALVVERDAQARICRIDFYERDQLAAARARYAALAASARAIRSRRSSSRTRRARRWGGSRRPSRRATGPPCERSPPRAPVSRIDGASRWTRATSTGWWRI